jgi:hypothetical protein
MISDCLDCAGCVSEECDERVLVVTENGLDQIVFENDYVGLASNIVASFYGGELVE